MSYRVVLGNENDFNDLIEFFEREHSPRLPAPSPRAIGLAIQKRQLLLVRTPEGDIAATAATLDVTPPNAQQYVGEFAGTRVTKLIGRTEPIAMQRILVVLRILSFVGANYEALADGTHDTLFALIKKDNNRSACNLRACSFSLFSADQRPRWLRYDEISWNGKIVTAEWDYYFATAHTVRCCAAMFFEHRMHNGYCDLTCAGAQQRIEIELPGLRYHLNEFKAIASGEHRIELSPPPAELILNSDEEEP